MNSEPQGTPSRTQEALDPEKLLLELGWSDSPVADRGSHRTRAAKHYCSFCWTAIPDGEVECGSCGRSLAEILAAGAKAPRADTQWAPTRLGGAAAVPRPRISPQGVVALSTPAASTVAVRRGIPAALRLVGSVVLVVALLASSALAGAWLGSLTMKEPPAKRSALPESDGGSLSGAPVAVRIQWDNPHPELKLELVGPDGSVLTSSDTDPPSALTLKPGDYQLRTRDRDGLWSPVERAVSIGSQSAVVLSPSPEAVASYYTDRGRRLRDAKRLQDAEQAWRTAIQVLPRHTDARLQLAEHLILSGKYEEAREHLRLVRAASPDDPRLLRLMRKLRQ